MASDVWDWYESLPSDAQAEWGAMREIVRAVADSAVMISSDVGLDIHECSGCRRDVLDSDIYDESQATGEPLYIVAARYIIHKPTCIVIKARALVEQWQAVKEEQS